MFNEIRVKRTFSVPFKNDVIVFILGLNVLSLCSSIALIALRINVSSSEFVIIFISTTFECFLQYFRYVIPYCCNLYFQVLLKTHICPNAKLGHFLILNTNLVGTGVLDGPKNGQNLINGPSGRPVPTNHCKFRVRQTTLSTWVKSTKGLKNDQK